MEDGMRTPTPTEEPAAAEPTQPIAHPLARTVAKVSRIVRPQNVSLSAKDLQEFWRIICDINEKSKIIQYNGLDLTQFRSEDHAKSVVNEEIQVFFSYTDHEGKRIEGLGEFDAESSSFPERLRSVFFCNATHCKRRNDFEPRNVISAFLGFEPPSLKIDFSNMPSNPTENRSVIDVYGDDEDWVVNTELRLKNFFSERSTSWPVIHNSGTYDLALSLLVFPLIIWGFFLLDASTFGQWMNTKSVFLNFAVGSYLIIISLLIYRLLFQYLRWLFPPIEYYKENRTLAQTQRKIVYVIVIGIALAALYDAAKALVT